MADTAAEAKRYKTLTYIFGGLLLLVVLGAIAWIFGLRVCFHEEPAEEPISANFPPGGPAEFLYLDNARVAAYLAQVDGGVFSNEKQSQKLTRTLSGKLNVQNTLEASASKATENSVEREVTPTAASSFFALEAGLKNQKVLKRVRLPRFETEIEGLRPGQFVRFKTRALLSPIYTSPYRASERPRALTAIFPGGEPDLEDKAAAARLASRRFVGSLGKSPRIVFSLHARKPGQRRPFTYLMPLGARALTEEVSLIKYGGGKFTVVGKVVRVFPEEGNHHEPAYVDSDTLRTWERPLLNAPDELLCRTDPRCATKVREEDLRSAPRQTAIKESRGRALNALHRQTTIEGRGAVILPVAIYK